MNKRIVPLAGILQGQEEIDAVNKVLNSSWQCEGQYTVEVEGKIAELCQVPYCVMTNSGTSANYLALCGLNFKNKEVVLTSACGFNATLSPIVQLGLTPWLVDFSLDTFNIDLDQIAQSLYYSDKYGKKISTLLIAANLGAALDMDFLYFLKNKYGFLLILDCCESFGTQFDGNPLASYADITTFSFYPSHQLNAFGGGGAIVLKDKNIYNRIKSLKSWGKENIRIGEYCTKFTTEVGGIPYDAGYSYPELAYNMRILDGQSAYLLEQLKRLPYIIEKRTKNFNYLYDSLSGLPLQTMNWVGNSTPVPFAFPILLYQDGLRDKMVNYLEENGVRSRLFFGGNLLKHLAYKDLEYLSLNADAAFPVADKLMKNAFFVGVHPLLDETDTQYIADVIHQFFSLEKA